MQIESFSAFSSSLLETVIAFLGEILINSLSKRCNFENLYLNWNIVFVLMLVFLEIILELIPGVWWWHAVECVVCTCICDQLYGRLLRWYCRFSVYL